MEEGWMAAHKARRQMPPPTSTPLLTEIVMIDETKGENEKDVWKDPFRFPPTNEMMEESPATDCR